MNQKDLYTILNANTEEDILRHFPSRYEDIRPSILSSTPTDGERVVVKGKINSLKSFSARGTSIIRFHLKAYGDRDLPCILFNQPFYLNKLSSYNDELFIMYYSESRKAYLVSYIMDVDSYFAITGIKPCYSLPKGISASYFTSYVKKLLSYPKEASYVVSKVPKKYIEKYHLMNEYDAYRSVHLPRDENDKHNGLRVFKYEEALSYCIKALSIRAKANQKKKDNPNIDKENINKFVAKLPYPLTKDQLTAIREIINDMLLPKVMFRLLQGDVGTGKTIVGFVALYANYLRGKQGVLMAPTFELASQHYQNALKVFKDYPIRIAFLAGNSLTAKEKNNVLKGLANKEIDILISTHSAISDKVVFKDLGLSIIDEQQLFGVKQREELISKGNSDILMMSATPIPRTLSQIVNSDLDVSTLEQYPRGPRNVKTQVVRSTDPIIEKAINKALAAKRQIFVVVPKIEESSRGNSSAEKVYQDISERFGVDKVQLLHGRIKKDEQERIYNEFLKGNKPILVSTTVIEVGIDVSSACLLIIYDANYFGLSSLHQLRGRIGRSGEFALALLIYDGNDKDVKDKLEFLADNSDGLKISTYDLQHRGSGSYFGEKQSGSSELSICNFVDDYTVLKCAKEDALEILNNPSISDNASYLKSLDLDKPAYLA